MKAKKILIVDDDPAIREWLKELLTMNGYEVIEANSGDQGMELARQYMPDLVITDLLLPGEHGLALLEEIKQSLFIPVIVISGIYKRSEIEKMPLNERYDDFFEKPVKAQELLSSIKRILNE